MRILFGVQGTGNGHIARARAMQQSFENKNVAVDFLFSGRERNKYFSMEPFGDFETRRGLTFCVNKGKVNYWQTAANNNLWQFRREVAELDLSGYDLVLNDFEPVSAWAAKQQNITTIGISHQNAFRYPIPVKGANWVDKKVVKYFAPTKFSIGLHWYHFDQPLLPPIIHTHGSQAIRHEAFVLVYLPFERLEAISDLLFRFTRQSFVCYHPEVSAPYQEENIQYQPLSQPNFQHHLLRCGGVIANGGFELPSEALSLGKKLLLKPLAGQFEQLTNVATLEHLGLAHSMDYLDASAVRDWLDEKQADQVQFPNVADAITEWILSGEWHNSASLSDQLWDKVNFPEYVSFS